MRPKKSKEALFFEANSLVVELMCIALYDKGARLKNIQVIDDNPYKNDLNDPFNAIHLPSCIGHLDNDIKIGSPKQSWLVGTFVPFIKNLNWSRLLV